MANIYELISNIVQNFLMIWFISSFCGYKYKGIKRYLGFAMILLLDTVIISVIDYFTDYDGILSIISIMGFVIYSQIYLKEKLSVHIFISLFVMVIVFTISSVLFLMTSNFSNTPVGDLLRWFSNIRLAVLVLCRCVEYGVFKIILYIKSKYSLTYKEWTLFIVVLFLTWIEVMLFTRASMITNDISNYMLGASIIAVLINIFIYYFIIYISKAMEIKTEFSLIKMQYDNIKNTENNMKVLYDSIYGIKHDLEKHFLYIRTMEENGEKEEIIKYIDNVLGKQLKASHKIVFTENDVFNALMNIRLEICHQKNIHSSISVQSEAINEIRSEDIVILFGNIFDNAIEAAEKTLDKIIELNVRIQGEYISIYMENSFNGITDFDLKTTKQVKVGHGIGLKNVKKIVDNYNGMVKCFPNDKMFCCDILLQRNHKKGIK